MIKIYCVVCDKCRKNRKISFLKKPLDFCIVCSRRGNEGKKIFKEEE